jgi:hypothetical protein
MERHPEESDHHDLGWVVEMLRVIKIEEERRKRRRERDKDE